MHYYYLVGASTAAPPQMIMSCNRQRTRHRSPHQLKRACGIITCNQIASLSPQRHGQVSRVQSILLCLTNAASGLVLQTTALRCRRPNPGCTHTQQAGCVPLPVCMALQLQGHARDLTRERPPARARLKARRAALCLREHQVSCAIATLIDNLVIPLAFVALQAESSPQRSRNRDSDHRIACTLQASSTSSL